MLERPKWQRLDGADERLVNPTADLINGFRPHGRKDHIARKAKSEELKRKYPEFASGLLLIHEEIEKLNVGGRISLREYPSEAELDQHDHLVTEQLMFVETFVKEKFGSVESFMEWWRK